MTQSKTASLEDRSPQAGGEIEASHRWLSTQSIIEPLDRADLKGFAQAARRATEMLRPLAQEAPGIVCIFLFDLLRQAGDRLSLSIDGVAEAQRLAWMTGLGGQENASGLVRYFLAELDSLIEEAALSSRRVNPIILRARRFIETHYAEQLSLSRVAEEVGVARNYLSSLFRKECDITLTEFIHQVRIERSKLLLRSRSCSLAELATRVGYRNYRHFYRSFLRVCGVSPTVFIKQSHALAADSSGPRQGGEPRLPSPQAASLQARSSRPTPNDG